MTRQPAISLSAEEREAIARFVVRAAKCFGAPATITVRKSHNSGLHAATGADGGRKANAPKERMDIMDMSQFTGGQFLKVADLRENGPIRVTIVAVELSTKFDKPELVFDDGTTLSLNATNCRALVRHWGSDSKDWIGKQAELNLGQLEYNGEMKDSILIKPISPPLEDKKPVKRQRKADMFPASIVARCVGAMLWN